ncbi:right-handed parallel beta-helix repeat-containing protein, partial [Streptomyces sp. NPDC050255]
SRGSGPRPPGPGPAGPSPARPAPRGAAPVPPLLNRRLGAGSPALAAGAVIEDNGGKDYFGNRLKPGAPNIGAYAGRGLR